MGAQTTLLRGGADVAAENAGRTSAVFLSNYRGLHAKKIVWLTANTLRPDLRICRKFYFTNINF